MRHNSTSDEPDRGALLGRLEVVGRLVDDITSEFVYYPPGGKEPEVDESIDFAIELLKQAKDARYPAAQRACIFQSATRMLALYASIELDCTVLGVKPS